MAESSEVVADGVLGPLEVSIDGRPVMLSTGRLRTLLAVLAISAGRAVSVERLATALWGDEAPGNARRGVQTYLTRLRSVLGADLIGTTPTGYLLRAHPDQVDALRFVRLLDTAAGAGDPATERARLAEALQLWRGTPFDGVRSDWLERSEAPRLTERYLAGLERRIDLDLEAGRPGELVAELRELTGQHPLRESLWVRLLGVLDRCGRQAEALERYETIRVRLADEFGTDPGPELQQRYADLLAGAAGPARPEPVAGSPIVPRQLPADIDGFAGRDAALKMLDNLIADGDQRTAKAVVVSAIAGTAGVGKTALALHWAHQIADRFPDGQLYVNLRGFHPCGQAMSSANAVRGFLAALGVAPSHVPTELDAQTGLYRSLLAGRRMLVVLDNARDAEQVRPLLPGSPTCLVIVTSRNQLTSLVATEAAHPLALDLLTVDEARQLLANRLGDDRITAEPEAVDEIITRCARLPLALAIVAARAATHPTFTLAALARELRHAQADLGVFGGADPVTDIRTVFSWSHQTLGSGAARLFRLLGLHAGPDLTVPAAASLAALPVSRVRPLLAELTRAHLLTEHAPGRYACHDLLHAYAAELTEASDAEPDRSAARHRVLDHYLHTAHAASLLLYPQREPILTTACQPGVQPEELADHRHAQAWFTAEHRVLLTAVGYAADAGFDTHAWQLAWSLVEFLDRQGALQELIATQLTGLAAARRLAEQAGQARAHRDLARAYTGLGRYPDAHDCLRQAFTLYGELGDPVGQAHACFNSSWVLEREGNYTEALDHNQRALDMYRAAGHPVGVARAQNAIGWCYARLGDFRQTLTHCQQALAGHQQNGNRYGEAATWDSLGYAHHHLGDTEQAVACYGRALALNRELGDRGLEAEIHDHLGDAHQAAGRTGPARAAWRQALTILDELDLPAAGQVRAKLARPGMAILPPEAGPGRG